MQTLPIKKDVLMQNRIDLESERRIARYAVDIAIASGTDEDIEEAQQHEVIADSNLAYYDECLAYSNPNTLH